MKKTLENTFEFRILQTHFACDLSVCKGACCTFPGGTGAPIDENEVGILERAWETVQASVPEKHKEVVRDKGLFERMQSGAIALQCVDNRACVFVMYQSGIAFCSIQRAYSEGKFDWPKPQSCHLFPLRYNPRTVPALRFEEFSECRSAIQNGITTDTSLVSFLEVPLRRVFGKEFYEELERTPFHHQETTS